MDIVTLPLEESLLIHINREWVKITPFKSNEPGQVKIGIEAPKSVPVHREEIYNALQAKQKISDKA